ncbi:FKBP-type peptidyl-prolyl cis-trans isomerase [Ereboglobus sp. PH5-5]|uniref:FKBP-type peptidyl-prolyl cis-trans isomerase n=1 Tax=unclassified Ereboglobus TaxID=2626932 RepID=UPI00240626D2|nr:MULTISPECIES: FKBP-type peptidyl-prolyl cis-trans isomerase [unclassified Ereboglobus]MDF9826525.1 FKBP-type peptidyl-prolyl cis-trans isomerase [Ereboglobus sp. PH5-10]MDF9832715.1 FKBP-type peptidyl-prolyl cis-trans isomerase [Ereboglobus sp. PH5-5]
MRLLKLLAALLILATPAALHAQREKLPPADLEYVEKTWPDAQITSTGMRTIVMQTGTGEKAERGDRVSVLYKGMLLNGTVFDQTRSADHPFTFRVGRGEVIEGWEEGIPMMRVGEKRLLIIPFELGYGTRGDPPKIPRRSTLVFEVELVKVVKPDPETQIEKTPIAPRAKKKDTGPVTNVPPVKN